MSNQIIILIILIFQITIAHSQMNKDYDLQVTNANFNSEASELSAIKMDENIIYISDQQPRQLINWVDGNTNRSFYKYYLVGENEKLKKLLIHLQGKYNNGVISLSKDKNTVVYSKNSNDGKLNIYYSTFINGNWGEHQMIPKKNKNISWGHPYLSPYTDYLYFTSENPDGQGGTDIYRIKFDPDNWGEPENLGTKVNSKYDEMFPFIDSYGNIYFSSNRDGGLGGLDIYKYVPVKNELTSLDKPFNSEEDDFAYYSYYNENGFMSGLFSSNRKGGAGLDDIYFWNYDFKPVTLTGCIKHEKQKLAYLSIRFVSPNDTIISKTNKNGNYTATVNHKNHYYLEILSEDYHLVDKHKFMNLSPGAEIKKEIYVNKYTEHKERVKKIKNTEPAQGKYSNEKYEFHWIKIAENKWMLNNLDVATRESYLNPDFTRFGRYYTHNNAMNICPKGWHLPTVAEWEQLLSPPKNKQKLFHRNKKKSISFWSDTLNNDKTIKLNFKPAGGYSSDYGQFFDVNYYAYFWSSTQAENGDFLYIKITKNKRMYAIENASKYYGFSVRCIKD